MTWKVLNTLFPVCYLGVDEWENLFLNVVSIALHVLGVLTREKV